MTKTILKRIALPRSWNVPRKSVNRITKRFISRPNPGKNYVSTVSINTFLKEIIFVAKTRKEVKHVLKNKVILVNGTKVRDEKYPVGLFDVVDIPVMEKSYRLTLSEQGKMASVEIDAKEKSQIPKKVVGKSIIKGGKQQLNFFGSANLLSDEKVSIGDVAIINGKKIESVMKLAKGSTVLMTAGRHVGKIGTIKEILDSKITLVIDGNDRETLTKYAYVVADGKTEIKVR